MRHSLDEHKSWIGQLLLTLFMIQLGWLFGQSHWSLFATNANEHEGRLIYDLEHDCDS